MDTAANYLCVSKKTRRTVAKHSHVDKRIRQERLLDTHCGQETTSAHKNEGLRQQSSARVVNRFDKPERVEKIRNRK